jgi:hypothetical protein
LWQIWLFGVHKTSWGSCGFYRYYQIFGDTPGFFGRTWILWVPDYLNGPVGYTWLFVVAWIFRVNLFFKLYTRLIGVHWDFLDLWASWSKLGFLGYTWLLGYFELLGLHQASVGTTRFIQESGSLYVHLFIDI